MGGFSFKRLPQIHGCHTAISPRSNVHNRNSCRLKHDGMLNIIVRTFSITSMVTIKQRHLDLQRAWHFQVLSSMPWLISSIKISSSMAISIARSSRNNNCSSVSPLRRTSMARFFASSTAVAAQATEPHNVRHASRYCLIVRTGETVTPINEAESDQSPSKALRAGEQEGDVPAFEVV